MISAEKSKEYFETFYKKHPNYIREYKEKNKEKEKLYRKEYYSGNKDKFIHKTDCDICGRNMMKTNIKRHQKSKFCQIVAPFQPFQEQVIVLVD